MVAQILSSNLEETTINYVDTAYGYIYKNYSLVALSI